MWIFNSCVPACKEDQNGVCLQIIITCTMNHNYVIFKQLHVLTLLFSTGEWLDCVIGERKVSVSIHTDEKLSFWNAYCMARKRILGKRPLLIIYYLVCFRFSLFFHPMTLCPHV